MRKLVGMLALGCLFCLLPEAAPAQSLRFFGHGGSVGDNFVFPDRVKIDRTPPAAVNVGVADFTVEFWMRAQAADNPNTASCGGGNDWVNSNIIIDADRFNQPNAWGIGVLNSAIVFGIIDETGNGFTLCGGADPLDDAWHHVAVDRRAADGRMRIFIDGVLDAEGPVAGGPGADVSYPLGATPGNFCSPDGGFGSQSCLNSDPFLVFGAEKHGFTGINYSGHLDEVRLSSSLRYAPSFPVPNAPFVSDGDTAALYHFDEGAGSSVADASGQGGTGTIFFGGSAPAGPIRSPDSPFVSAVAGVGPTGRLALVLLFTFLSAPFLRARGPGVRRGDRSRLRRELR